MEIETKAIGTVTITDEQKLTLPEGIIGFEEYKKFALIDSEYEPFVWLQSLEEKNLAFLIVDPFLLY